MTGNETRPQGSQERREEIPALLEFTAEVPQAAELLRPKLPARQQEASAPEESVNEQAGGPGGGLADSQLCSISTSLIMHPGHLQMTGPHPFLYPFSSPRTHGSREHTPRLEAATPALLRPVNGDQESLTIAALPRVNAS